MAGCRDVIFATVSDTPRVVWQPTDVVDVRDAVFAARTYLEHRDLRALLEDALGDRRLDRACELGSGFGRMTPVLTEFADNVYGFEREPHFVAEAQRLYPEFRFTRSLPSSLCQHLTPPFR